ncbi:MAG: late competence development ComFB family protein [Candidatus Omnitrophica bacterium]|nr:late competence development ComFB family protein [Candidatus Omnitrophota bacterium]
MQARNIMEDIVIKYLDEMLALRFDLCTCEICRQDIIAYVLSRLPAKYITTDSGTIHAIMQQLRLEQSSLILKELAGAINIISKQPHHEESHDRNQAYKLLMEQIKVDRGADFSHYRDKVLKRRIALRMRSRNANTYSEYLQVLIHSPEEYEKLFEVLTINVSSFFRDAVVWDHLKTQILPELIARKKQQGVWPRKIRIWSAGCSHGEEPYSLAIMLYELLEKEKVEINVEIIATDIDKACLAKGKAGRYDQMSVKDLNPYYLRRFFIPINDEFQIVPHVKEFVHFKELNLIHDPGIMGVDMVICRNVFIYFNRSLQEYLIMKFHGALVRDGFFVMGSSENLLGEARQVFENVNRLFRIYKKIIVEY